MLCLYYYEGELPPSDYLRARLGCAAKDVRRPESLVWRLLLKQALYDLAVTDDPEAILTNLRATEGGKPYAEGVRFDFSPTHTAGLVALAIGDCGPIGLDAETPRGRDVSRLARAADRWFTPAENRRVQTAIQNRPQEAEAVFLRVWTAKEALVKRTGAGLAGMRRADTRHHAGCTLRSFDYENYILTVATSAPDVPEFRRVFF